MLGFFFISFLNFVSSVLRSRKTQNTRIFLPPIFEERQSDFACLVAQNPPSLTDTDEGVLPPTFLMNSEFCLDNDISQHSLTEELFLFTLPRVVFLSCSTCCCCCFSWFDSCTDCCQDILKLR